MVEYKKSNIFYGPGFNAFVQKIQKPDGTIIPGGRSTRPTFENYYTDIKNGVTFVNPSFIAELIPTIRKLSWINPDMGLALNDTVQLTNTGHKINFDHLVPPDQVDLMRQHIEDKQEFWGDGVARMNGLVNKMISQIWIAGALSTEWVVANDKTGINHLAYVNPETIVFRWNKRKLRFEPYQRQNFNTGQILGEKYVKLNHYTYKYFALNGDTDVPYGIPPFLTALNSLSTQSDMDKNIRYIMKQIGLLGFFEALMMKPAQKDGESDGQYKSRLTQTLIEAKGNLIDGIGEGIVMGYKEDHTFNFNSTTKNLSGVSDLYLQNEVQVANGLKISPDFIGAGNKGTETAVSIIFTKMLSQLHNVQEIVAANLKYGYTLELRLAGYKFNDLKVEFNPSTITDELKFQQAQEYKIRNVSNKYNMGIIGQEQAADELGYIKPDQKEPRAPIDDSATDVEKRQDQNDKSDKKTRDKAKPQPKRGDQKSSAAEFLIDFLLDHMNKNSIP